MINKLLKIILYIICFILFICIFLRILLLIRKKIYRYTHSEDIYHRNIKKMSTNKDNISRLFVITDCSKMNKVNFKNYIIEKIPILLEFHKKWFSKVLSNKKNNQIVSIYYDYNTKWKNTKTFSSIFYLDKRILITTFNHVYAGGYHLIMYGQKITDSKIIPNIKNSPKSLILPEYYALKTLYDYYKSNDINKLKLYNNRQSIVRLYSNISENIIKLSYQENISLKTKIIHYIFNNLINAFPKSKKMIRILFPVIFLPENNVFNNVSAIVINFKRNMTIKKLEKQIKKNNHQMIGGNYLSQFSFLKSNTFRKSVDIVCTMSYWKEAKYNLDTMVTFENLAIYPIYMTVLTNNNNINISYTISSKEINEKVIIDKLNGKYFDLDNSKLY